MLAMKKEKKTQERQVPGDPSVYKEGITKENEAVSEAEEEGKEEGGEGP